MASVDNSTSSDCSVQFDLEKVRESLAQDGVAVIPGVIPLDQCNKHISDIQEWLSGFGTGFPRNTNSVIHAYNIGHCEPAWATRLAVKPVFAALWETEKLLSSTDGISVSRPPESGETSFTEGRQHTLHHDQGPKKMGLHAYQGAVYLEDAEQDDWCMEFLFGSHNLHTEFFQNMASAGRSEFRRISDRELDWFLESGCERRRVGCPKGGIMLWDSRTVHAGALPLTGRRHSDRWRYVVFVSMGPAWWARGKDLAVKNEAYNNLKTTRHWWGQDAGSFRYGKSKHDFVGLPECAQTREARLIAGVTKYNFNDGQSNGPSWKPMWLD